MSALDRQEERERQIRELIREKTNLSGPVLYNLAAQITLLSPVGVPLSDYEEALEEKDNIIIQLEEQCGNLEDSLQAGHDNLLGLALGHITEFQKGAEWMADRLAFTAVGVEGEDERSAFDRALDRTQRVGELRRNVKQEMTAASPSSPTGEDERLGLTVEAELVRWEQLADAYGKALRVIAEIPKAYAAQLKKIARDALAASPSSPTGEDTGLREAAQHLEVIAHDLTRTDLEPNLHLIERRVELAYERVIAALTAAYGSEDDDG